MNGYVRVSPDVIIMANDGTIYVTWPDGESTTESEDEVGRLLRACCRSRSYAALAADFDTVLLERLLRQRLLVPWGDADVLHLHETTLDGPPTTDLSLCGSSAEDGRLLREYGGRIVVTLPDPSGSAQELAAIFRKRKSARQFPAQPLELHLLSSLLSTAVGVTSTPTLPRIRGGPPARPAYPSPGALYPVELALLAWNVRGLEAAAYRYQPFGQRLSLVCAFDAAAAIELLPGHPAADAAGLVVLWSDLFSSAFIKYGPKGYRLTLLEAGHLMQNLVLVAAALELPALPVAGFRDLELARALGLEQPEQVPLYGLLIGGVG